MIKNAFYEGEAFPKDFYENENSYKEVDKSKKSSRLLPAQLMFLLPPIAAQLLYYLFSFSLKNDGKYYFYQRTFNSIKMTEDDFDAALQTLIDIGIIDVNRRDETTYDYIVNYDKINEFAFPFKDMPNIEKIKLSTDITFRNIKANSSNGESIDVQVNELMRKLDSAKRSELIDRLIVLKAKEMNGEKIEELPSDFFRLSKKNV